EATGTAARARFRRGTRGVSDARRRPLARPAARRYPPASASRRPSCPFASPAGVGWSTFSALCRHASRLSFAALLTGARDPPSPQTRFPPPPACRRNFLRMSPLTLGHNVLSLFSLAIDKERRCTWHDAERATRHWLADPL